MKKLYVIATCLVALSTLAGLLLDSTSVAIAEEPAASQSPDQAAVERSRKTVQTLDNIFKQTIVLITDKYVHDEDDFAAGSAAVLLFENVSKAGPNKVRLIDATGEPYDPENVAQDEFEREGIERLKAGDQVYEQVVRTEDGPRLRALTPVPVVMKKCVMCHEHYGDAKDGEPIGVISYTVPIE